MGDKKKFLLRIDAGIFVSLEKWAADDLRSVNAQIEFLLTDAVRKAGRRRTEQEEETDGSKQAPDRQEEEEKHE
jgi:hypothetical protein